MNGPARTDIVQFIERHSGRRLTAAEEADVLAALGLEGDAASAFMAAFGAEFRVDLTGYEYAFHHFDAGSLRRPGWPVPSRRRFGVRLPIPVSSLTQAAQSGQWPVHYPVLPPAVSRHWLNVPLILVGLPLLGMVLLALFRLF